MSSNGLPSGLLKINGDRINPATEESVSALVLAGTYYKVIVDSSVLGTMYVGYALPGSNTASAVWRIRRFVDSGGVLTSADADGNGNYDNVWDNHDLLPYS